MSDFAPLTEKDLREAAAFLESVETLLEVAESGDVRQASAVDERLANVSVFAFTGLIKKFPGLCDNIDRSVEDIDVEIKKFERLRDKWRNSKVQGARAVVYAASVAIVGYIFGSLGKAGIAAAVALVSEGVISLFLKAMIALKRLKKRKALESFDPKMVAACEKAKKQKAKDVEKTLKEMTETKPEVDMGKSTEKDADVILEDGVDEVLPPKELGLQELDATFDTLFTLYDALDTEKIASSEQYAEIEERVAGVSNFALKHSIKKFPGLCKWLNASPKEIQAEIRRLKGVMKKAKKEILLDKETRRKTRWLAVWALLSAFLGAPYLSVGIAAGATIGWTVVGLSYLYIKILVAMNKMALRGILDGSKKETLLNICAMQHEMTPAQMQEWLEEQAQKNPQFTPRDASVVDEELIVEDVSGGEFHTAGILEADLDEMETSIERMYLAIEDFDGINAKNAGLRDKSVEKMAQMWAKLISKAPGLCRYLNMTQYGLKKVIDRVEKESALVKRHLKGRNADAAKGAAIAIFARVKGFPPGSEIIAQFALPLVERLAVLYLKGLWLLHKLMAKYTVYKMAYDALDLACKTVYPMSTPDEKVILKEEKEYQARLERGTAAPGLPPARL